MSGSTEGSVFNQGIQTFTETSQQTVRRGAYFKYAYSGPESVFSRFFIIITERDKMYRRGGPLHGNKFCILRCYQTTDVLAGVITTRANADRIVILFTCI